MTLTIGQAFKNKLLAEARKPRKSEETAEDPAVVAAREQLQHDMSELLERFPKPNERAVITALVSLGVPVRPLEQRVVDVRDGIANAAQLYMKSATFRTWLKKLLSSITAAQSAPVKEAVDVASAFDKKLTNKMQHMVFSVISALGLPDVIIQQRQRDLLAGVRKTAALAMEDQAVRKYLISLANELGVKDTFTESAEQVNEFGPPVNVNNDKDVKMLLVSFLQELGIDPQSNRSIEMQMKTQDVVKKLNAIQADGQKRRQLALALRNIDNLVK